MGETTTGHRVWCAGTCTGRHGVHDEGIGDLVALGEDDGVIEVSRLGFDDRDGPGPVLVRLTVCDETGAAVQVVLTEGDWQALVERGRAAFGEQ